MKQLTLIRHAKSSWKNAYLLDIERPLKKRGKRDAPIMGKRLAKRKSVPDLIVSSSAKRAMATAEIIAQEIEYPVEDIVVNEKLYGAGVSKLLKIIRGLDDGFEHAACVGHNPGLTDFVNHVSSFFINNVPTCGIVVMTFNIDAWESVGHVEPAEVDFDYPKKEHPG